eukprot:scaffold210564_cov33-Prasinocladus_malaysianus.AAC.1
MPMANQSSDLTHNTHSRPTSDQAASAENEEHLDRTKLPPNQSDQDSSDSQSQQAGAAVDEGWATIEQRSRSLVPTDADAVPLKVS